MRSPLRGARTRIATTDHGLRGVGTPMPNIRTATPKMGRLLPKTDPPMLKTEGRIAQKAVRFRVVGARIDVVGRRLLLLRKGDRSAGPGIRGSGTTLVASRARGD
jgi:hypothetical protein